VLIVGAGRGIGAGVAEVFLESGASVAVNALSDKHALPFVAELQRQYGQGVCSIIADATSSEGARQIAAECRAKLGSIDILVNAVGDAIGGSLVPVPGTGEPAHTDEEIELILDLNLRSAINCIRATADEMIARRSGKIINIASSSALRGLPSRSVYAAAKMGIAGLTRSLAREWAAFHMTVNAIAPGVFPDRRAGNSSRIEELERRYVPDIPLGRLGGLRDVGLLALFLASAAGDYMTGQVIALDGGLSA